MTFNTNGEKRFNVLQKLNDHSYAPPSHADAGIGFTYTHFETGHISHALDHITWMEKIRDHRKGNNLPPITEAEAENQLCQTLPPEFCSHSENNRAFVNTRLSWSDVFEGAKSYAKFALSGFKAVSQDESNRRARICGGCFLRVPIQGCGACSKIATLITGDVARLKTKHDDLLEGKACAACKCPNKSLVHFPLSLLEESDGGRSQSGFTEFCWRRLGGENYLPEAA